MDIILRWSIAIIAAAMVFTSSMAVAGVEQANAPPGPALYQTAAPAAGDEALYKTALVVVRDGEGEYVDMEARFAFERLPDGRMLDDGVLVPVQRIVSEWHTQEFEFDISGALAFPNTAPIVPTLGPNLAPSCTMGPTGSDPESMEAWQKDFEDCMADWEQDFEAEMERFAQDLQAQMEQMQRDFERWSEDFEFYMEAWSASLGRTVHRVQAQGWHLGHHGAVDAVSLRPGDSELIDPRPGAPLTGLLDDLPWSFTQMSSDPVVTVLGTAPSPCGWRHSLQDGPQDLRRPITVHGQCPPDMFLGFADVVPMEGPLQMRVVGEDDVNGNQSVVFAVPGAEDDLRIWFTESVPYPVRVLSRTDAVPPHIQEALGDSYDEPAFYVLHELVRFDAGPGAASAEREVIDDWSGNAGFWGADARGFDGPRTIREALNDAASSEPSCQAAQSWLQSHPRANVVASARTDAWRLVLAEGKQMLRLDVHDDGTCENVESTAGTSLGPGPMPTVVNGAAALQQWHGAAANAYGHDGIDARILTMQGEGHTISIDSDGRLHAWGSDTQPEPRFSDPAWNPNADGDWNLHSASSGAWSMPSPATAATLAVGSAAAGALILVWPALKGLAGGIGLFSRIRKEDLLEHPVRADVMEMIQSDPGIHFQELVRRSGKGRGTMEHHVRKLVGAGLLVEKAERGFTCYFPKGEVDRRLMDVAPLFKADGARRVVQAVQAQPGTATMELASVLGMATSTVNYHVKRLVDAGLIEPTREGRFVRLRLTGLGDEALGRFGRT